MLQLKARQGAKTMIRIVSPLALMPSWLLSGSFQSQFLVLDSFSAPGF